MAPLLASEFDRGRFLKATDLTGDARFKIKTVTVETLGPDKDRKLVVWFTNDSRGLVLNKTNIRALTPVLGDDTRIWEGAVITVFPTTTTLGANTVPCLRVRPPKVSVAAPEPAPSVMSPASQGASPSGDFQEIPAKARRTNDLKNDLKDDLNDDFGF
jgi:hypothetical protein